jgi:hypothetical protein
MTMKLGKLDFKDYAAKKPVAVTPAGKFLTAQEVAAQPALSLGSLFALDVATQLKLALERYALEPAFRLGILGAGLLTKDEVISHLKQQTDLGKEILRAEMGYCTELVGVLAGGIVPTSPPTPVKPLPPMPDWRRTKRCIWLKIRNRALFCENTTDPVTTPIANYRIAHVHPVFHTRGFTLNVLLGADDKRANFVPLAKNVLTVYLNGVGHGAYPLYTGHWGDHILEVGHYDPAEVKDKAIHFLSCQTARDLGPDTVAHGAKCYAGYTENFTFVWDDGTTPAVNEFELFMKSDATFDILMANGATALQAYNAVIQAFNTAAALVPNTAAATWLTWDRSHFKLHGNGETVIWPYRTVKVCFPIPVMEQEDALVRAGQLSE